MPSIRHAHSSSRFDRSPASLLLWVRAQLDKADLITLTEVGNDKRVRDLIHVDPEWEFVQVEDSRPPGGDECAVLYRKARFPEKPTVKASLLTTAGLTDRGDRRVYSLDVRFPKAFGDRAFLVSTCHLPAHIEGANGWRSTTSRNVRAFKWAIAKWQANARKALDRGDYVALVADWNLDVRRSWVQKWLRANLPPELRSSWLQRVRGLPTAGTHGSRIIDDTRSNLDLHRIDLVDGFGSSDHTPYFQILTEPVEVAPVPTPKPKPIRHPAPSPVYLGPAAHTSGPGNKPIRRIVIHSTVSPCKAGGARDIARYFRSKNSGGSAHYVVDPGEVVQVVFDSVVAWHAPPNGNSIGIEMCDMPGPVPGDKPWSAAWKAARNRWRWNRPEQKAMLKRTATLTAELCLAYNVPPWFLRAADLQNGKSGVTTHNNVSTAFRRSTHWDPGFWPRYQFMRMVRAEVKRLTNERSK